MAGPLDIDNAMQRSVLRKGVDTATGGCALVTQYDAPLQPRFLDRPPLYHGERATAAFSRLAQ